MHLGSQDGETELTARGTGTGCGVRSVRNTMDQVTGHMVKNVNNTWPQSWGQMDMPRALAQSVIHGPSSQVNGQHASQGVTGN